MPEQMIPAACPICPSCGRANACAPAASGRFDVSCWCQSVVVDPAAIAKLPASERGKACLCRRCAGGMAADQAAKTSATD